MWLLGTLARLFVFIRLEQHLQHCYSKMECVYLRYCIRKCLFAPVLCVCVSAPLFGRTLLFLSLIWDLLWNCHACTCVKYRLPLCTEYISYLCGAGFIHVAFVRWEPRGSVFPRLDVWSRHTRGLPCPMLLCFIPSPWLQDPCFPHFCCRE